MSQKEPKFVLRLPDGLRTRIKKTAKSQDRSMNSEIVRVLLRAFPAPEPAEQPSKPASLPITEHPRKGCKSAQFTEHPTTTEEPPMVNDNQPFQERTYRLPDDMAQHICAFQHNMGLVTEEEAVQWLLGDALKGHDTSDSISVRILRKHSEGSTLRECSKEILVGHPMVEYIEHQDRAVVFKLTNNIAVRITEDGVARTRRGPLAFDD